MIDSARNRIGLLAAAFAYALCVVYGSLIPFDVRDLTWAEAWAGFADIRYLQLGAASRADWVANILLYIPLGFLLAAGFWPWRRPSLQPFALGAAFVLGVALAVSVEFAQQFFAPRTVSLNDLIAETMGTGLGVAGWAVFGDRVLAAAAVFRRGGRGAFRVALLAVVLAVVVMSLFPFDFVLTGDELAARLARVGDGLWRLPGFARSPLHGIAGILVVMAMYVPVGVLIGLRPDSRPAAAAGWAFGIAVAIEIVQLFLVGGQTSLWPPVWAAGGGALGHAATRLPLDRMWPFVQRRLPLLAAVAAPAYLLAVVWLNDLPRGGWQSFAAGTDGFRPVTLLPFYYHYFTTEAVAALSAATRFALYLPVGVLLWAARGGPALRGGAGVAAALAAILALTMELARWLKPGLHPDFTNVLIGAVAGGVGFAACRWSLAALTDARPPTAAPEPAVAPTGAPDPAQAAAQPAPARAADAAAADGALRWPEWAPIAAAALLLAAVEVVYRAPLGTAWAAAGLAGYAALLWMRPRAWLVAVPALLPVLDPAPWSGGSVFGTFDWLVAATVVVLAVRRPPAAMPGLGRAAWLAIGLVVVSYLAALDFGGIAAAIGGTELLTQYFSPLNGLRISRGLLWALVLLPFLADAVRRDEAAFARFAVGMAIGLAGVAVGGIVERLAFVGPFDLTTAFRITSTFASAHIGGGHLGVYLVAALPFLLPLVLRPRSLGLGAAAAPVAAAIAVAGAYTLLASFQRAALAGAILTVLLFILADVASAPQWSAARRAARAAAAVVFVLAVTGLLAVLLQGTFVSARFADVGAGLQARESNWQYGLALRTPGLAGRMFGEGVGSYPRLFLVNNLGGAAPATYAVIEEDGGRHLRLSTGTGFYFEQRVAPRPGADYTLSVELRGDTPGRLVVMLCRKALLYSFGCRTVAFDVEPLAGWTPHEATLVAPAGAPTAAGALLEGLFGMPATLALLVEGDRVVLGIDDVRLTDPDGTDLIANGGFEAGLSHWTSSSDRHTDWRIKNQVLMALVERGWFGLLASAVLAGLAAVRLLAAATRGDRRAPVLLASLAGFLMLGVTEAWLEAPRLGGLYYLLVFLTLCLTVPQPRPARRRHRPPRQPHGGPAGA